MPRQDNGSQRLKFSEWRPIGVCDDAPSGVQKAQMFTREDFLIVTGPGVTRDNWQNKPEVMEVLNRYAAKLAKQSMKTGGMTQPTVSKISLVGAIMKLSVTPTLNKESKDGKLQLFQIKFEDKGPKKKKKTPWMAILGTLLVVLLILCLLLGIAIYQKTKTRQFTSKSLKLRNLTTSYCQDPTDRSKYHKDLNEASRILQNKTDELLYKGRLTIEKNCIERLPKTSFKEKRFLECYLMVKQGGLFAQIPFSERKKVNACQQEICKRNRHYNPSVCLQ